MARHFNPSIVKRLQRIFGFKTDTLSDDVSGVVAVVPVTPVTTVLGEGSSAATIFTSDAERDTYITCIILSGSKDSGAAATTLSVRGYQENKQVTLAGITGITATAERDTVVVNFIPAMLIDRSSIVDLSQSGAWNSKRAIIYGYKEEVKSM